MQETAKVNYIQYGKGSKRGKAKSNGKGPASGGSSGKPPNPEERVGKFHYPQTFIGDMVKEDIRRGNHVNQWKQSAGNVP